jgi:hypothetical protein
MARHVTSFRRQSYRQLWWGWRWECAVVFVLNWSSCLECAVDFHLNEAHVGSTPWFFICMKLLSGARRVFSYVTEAFVFDVGCSRLTPTAGARYDLLRCNCNHFSEALLNELTLPSHLNRGARVGGAITTKVMGLFKSLESTSNRQSNSVSSTAGDRTSTSTNPDGSSSNNFKVLQR